jgi:hypothetical protein
MSMWLDGTGRHVSSETGGVLARRQCSECCGPWLKMRRQDGGDEAADWRWSA